MINSITGRLKPPIKLFWWRLENSEHGNFGDEITKELISKLFNRRVIWAPPESCDMIGAGSIIEETTENKGRNRPFLWSSGFIRPGDLSISESDYKIAAVRGKVSLARIFGDRTNIKLGDAGLLASHLLAKKPPKKHKLGVLPHYIDKDVPYINKLRDNKSIHIIDVTWPTRMVVEEIAKCETLLSSSLHGLIVADSLGIPNAHIRLGGRLTGGTYKFEDYFSIYGNERYRVCTPNDLGTGASAIVNKLYDLYVPVPAKKMQDIKNSLIESFPIK